MGLLRAGWSVEKFDAPGASDETTLTLSAQVDHRFTSKTGITLAAYRRSNETDFAGADYMLTHQIDIGYHQQITPKVRFNLNASYNP